MAVCGLRALAFCDGVCVEAQESPPLLPHREEAGGPAPDDSDEEEGPEPGEEYEAREDELDAPRDYDDYTDNAHHSHHHD